MRHAYNHWPPLRSGLCSPPQHIEGNLDQGDLLLPTRSFTQVSKTYDGGEYCRAEYFIKSFSINTEKKQHRRRVINLYYVCLLPLCFLALFLQVWQSCYIPLLRSLPPLLSNLVLGSTLHKRRVLLVFLGGT